MNTENQTLDNTMRQKYFLVSKKWTVVVLLLALLAYAGAVLWSEFVFSVSTSDGIKQLEADKKTSHINCKDIVQFNVKPTELTPKRNPWLLETFNVYSNIRISSKNTCLKAFYSYLKIRLGFEVEDRRQLSQMRP